MISGEPPESLLPILEKWGGVGAPPEGQVDDGGVTLGRCNNITVR